MSKTITSLLVGAHFRPPAKQVLECLPSGAGLILLPEPENPYDEFALKVLVWPGEIPEVMRGDLDAKLQGTGTDLGDLLASEEPLWLGYVAASGGKPLAKAGMEGTGNREFLQLMAASPGHSAKLAFNAAGLPLVMLSEGSAS